MDLSKWEQEAEEHIRQFCRQHCELLGQKKGRPITFDYRYEHTRVVAAVAAELAAVAGVDPVLARIAAWLHDVARCWDPALNQQQNQARFDNHGVAGAKEAAAFLVAVNFPQQLIPQVEQAIANHVGYVKDHQLESPLDALLWDADKLSKINGAGLMHFLGVHLVYEDQLLDMKEYLAADDHMLEKICDSLNMEYARRWGKKELANTRQIRQQLLRAMAGQLPALTKTPSEE